jgi:hypothetical protein
MFAQGRASGEYSGVDSPSKSLRTTFQSRGFPASSAVWYKNEAKDARRRPTPTSYTSPGWIFCLLSLLPFRSLSNENQASVVASQDPKLKIIDYLKKYNVVTEQKRALATFVVSGRR